MTPVSTSALAFPNAARRDEAWNRRGRRHRVAKLEPVRRIERATGRAGAVALVPLGRGANSGGLAGGNGVAEDQEQLFDSRQPFPDLRYARFQGREPRVLGGEPRVGSLLGATEVVPHPCFGLPELLSRPFLGIPDLLSRPLLGLPEFLSRPFLGLPDSCPVSSAPRIPGIPVFPAPRIPGSPVSLAPRSVAGPVAAAPPSGGGCGTTARRGRRRHRGERRRRRGWRRVRATCVCSVFHELADGMIRLSPRPRVGRRGKGR